MFANWLRTAVEVLQFVVLVLTFIITLVEMLYEGEGGSGKGQEKKKEALALWEQIFPKVRATIASFAGERWASFVERVLTTEIVGFVIDLLVLLFNRKGLFASSKNSR